MGPTIDATITVNIELTNVNEAPTIDDALSDAFNVDENTETTVVIQTYMATDVDADTTLTWSLEGADAGDFTITKNTAGHGELKFANVPNFEMPADTIPAGQTKGDNVYDIIVIVKDNGIPGSRGASDQLDARLPVAVTVNDVNDQPVVSGDASPVFPEIEFDVEVLDTEALTVPGAYTFTDEDEDDVTVTWSLSGDDGDHFDITADADGNGVLIFKNPTPDTNLKPADREKPQDMGSGNDYEVTVEADDGQGESNSVGTFTVTVTVTNVDETPEITTTGPSHARPSFDEIEYDATTADLDVVTYAARDEEGEAITWSLSTADAGDFFMIDSNSGLLSFRDRPDYEDPQGTPATPGDEPDNTYEFVVQATDASTSPDNTARNTREFGVTVTVINVNETPEVTGPDDNPDYPETPYDSDELPPMSPPSPPATRRCRTSPGPSAEPTRACSSSPRTPTERASSPSRLLTCLTSSGLTSSDLKTCSLTVRYEGDGTYEFTVQAYDGLNTGTWDYAVTVTGVNETPEFLGTPDNIAHPR